MPTSFIITAVSGTHPDAAGNKNRKILMGGVGWP
jgi:hypothetical protein